MGERMTNVQSIQIGDTHFDISDDFEIAAFTVDKNADQEFAEDQPILITRCDKAEFTCIARVNRIGMLKFMGFWDFAIDNCPSKRVVHLMKNHKDDRVKLKNYHRAIELIGKMLRKERSNDCR